MWHVPEEEAGGGMVAWADSKMGKKYFVDLFVYVVGFVLHISSPPHVCFYVI
jgi:hypothetical protein